MTHLGAQLLGRRSLICHAVALLGAAPVTGARIWAPDGYCFRFGFWRNLHQMLIGDASGSLGESSPLSEVDRRLLATLNPDEKSRWSRARATYIARFSGRHLLFDPELRALGGALSDVDDDAPLSNTIAHDIC